MTLRNRLIAEAKKRPSEIIIRQCDVYDVARFASYSWQISGMSEQQIVADLLAGRVKLMGVPLRVSGEPCVS